MGRLKHNALSARPIMAHQLTVDCDPIATSSGFLTGALLKVEFRGRLIARDAGGACHEQCRLEVESNDSGDRRQKKSLG